MSTLCILCETFRDFVNVTVTRLDYIKLYFFDMYYKRFRYIFVTRNLRVAVKSSKDIE